MSELSYIRGDYRWPILWAKNTVGSMTRWATIDVINCSGCLMAFLESPRLRHRAAAMTIWIEVSKNVIEPVAGKCSIIDSKAHDWVSAVRLLPLSRNTVYLVVVYFVSALVSMECLAQFVKFRVISSWQIWAGCCLVTSFFFFFLIFCMFNVFVKR